MAAIDAGVLPTVKCSSCGEGVEITAMGDHVCGHGNAFDSFFFFCYHTDSVDRVPSPPPPAPPPKSDEMTTSPPAGYMWESRQKPLPRIDPSMASMCKEQFLFISPANTIQIAHSYNQTTRVRSHRKARHMAGRNEVRRSPMNNHRLVGTMRSRRFHYLVPCLIDDPALLPI